MEEQIFYGLFSDGGNCYSSYGNDNWYWMSTKDDPECTRTQFAKRLKNAGIRKAERNYREYCPDFIQTKIFTSKESFLKACKKVGLNPRFDD